MCEGQETELSGKTIKKLAYSCDNHKDWEVEANCTQRALSAQPGRALEYAGKLRGRSMMRSFYPSRDLAMSLGVGTFEAGKPEGWWPTCESYP